MYQSSDLHQKIYSHECCCLLARESEIIFQTEAVFTHELWKMSEKMGTDIFMKFAAQQKIVRVRCVHNCRNMYVWTIQARGGTCSP